MISKSPITDKRIAELGSNMVSDLCKEFEEKYNKVRLELLFTREHLENVLEREKENFKKKEEEIILRVVQAMKEHGRPKGLLSPGPISEGERQYWESKCDAAFERLKNAPKPKEHWEHKHKGNVDPMEAT